MERAVDNLNTTATHVSQSGSTPASSTNSNAIGGDTVSLSSDMVSLMNSRNSFDANTKTAEVTDQMTHYALDMFA